MAHLFHIWCVDEQKLRSPPPGPVMAFSWYMRWLQNYRLTYLLTYLLTYYKRQLRKENEEKRILQVGDMLASPPNVRSLGVRGLGLHVPLTVLPLFDLQLRAASQSARCFHISKSGNCQEVGRHPVRATSARDIAWLLSHRVRANAGQYMHRHSGSRDTNILPLWTFLDRIFPLRKKNLPTISV